MQPDQETPAAANLVWRKTPEGNLRLETRTGQVRGIVWTQRSEGEFKFRVGGYFAGSATVAEAQARALAKASAL
jgi:hypothetical protein